MERRSRSGSTLDDRLTRLFERAGLADADGAAAATRRLYSAGHRNEVNTMGTASMVGDFDELVDLGRAIACALTKGQALVLSDEELVEALARAEDRSSPNGRPVER